VRLYFTDHDVLGDTVRAGIAMKTALIDQHPQAVKDFVTGSAKAVDWVAEHPEEARKLVAQIWKSGARMRRVRLHGQVTTACPRTRYTRITTPNSGSMCGYERGTKGRPAQPRKRRH
jgi:NMT1/THI5 like